jgi:Zn-finger nucleic acid-binding protein
LELALAEAREVKRMCPADSSALAKEIAHGVIIDRCPTCKGVWLDAGEMERMNQEVAEEVWKATAFGRSLG